MIFFWGKFYSLRLGAFDIGPYFFGIYVLAESRLY